MMASRRAQLTGLIYIGVRTSKIVLENVFLFKDFAGYKLYRLWLIDLVLFDDPVLEFNCMQCAYKSNNNNCNSNIFFLNRHPLFAIALSNCSSFPLSKAQ